MGTIASQITSLTSVYSTVYSGADQRKYQSSASLAFVRGIHRGPLTSPHKWPVTRKMFPFDDVIMNSYAVLTCVQVITWLVAWNCNQGIIKRFHLWAHTNLWNEILFYIFQSFFIFYLSFVYLSMFRIFYASYFLFFVFSVLFHYHRPDQISTKHGEFGPTVNTEIFKGHFHEKYPSVIWF